MKKLKNFSKTLNYKILSALPVMGICLVSTHQTSIAMFRSALSSASRIVQNSTSRTLNPSAPKVTYLYRNGTRIAITHNGSNQNKTLNTSTSASPSSNTNTLSRTSSAPATTSISTPSPNPSLNVRPKTSTSSTLQSQSTNNTMSNRDNKATSSTAIINTTSTSTSSPNSDSNINPKTSQPLKHINLPPLARVLLDDEKREKLANRLSYRVLEAVLQYEYTISKNISDSIKKNNSN